EAGVAVGEVDVASVEGDFTAGAIEGVDAGDVVGNLAEGPAGVHDDGAADGGGDAAEVLQAAEAVAGGVEDGAREVGAGHGGDGVGRLVVAELRHEIGRAH